jgi:hypothetical protein
MKSPIHALLLFSSLLLAVSCGKVAPDAQTTAVTPGNAASPSLSTRADEGGARGGGPASASDQPLEIPSGTRVSIRLQSSISSARAQRGDRFHAVLDSPLQVGGQTVAPVGSDVTGMVVAAAHSGRLEHPGMLTLELSSIQLRGKEVAINSSRITARGASHKKRNLGWIGGGAGGGALLGGLMGGGKGALIGGAAGAGAGTVTAAATGKHDVAFNAEHQLTFELRQQVEIR